MQPGKYVHVIPYLDSRGRCCLTISTRGSDVTRDPRTASSVADVLI